MPKLVAAGFLFLTVSGFHLLLFVAPNPVYLANVVLHLAMRTLGFRLVCLAEDESVTP